MAPFADDTEPTLLTQAEFDAFFPHLQQLLRTLSVDDNAIKTIVPSDIMALHALDFLNISDEVLLRRYGHLDDYEMPSSPIIIYAIREAGSVSLNLDIIYLEYPQWDMPDETLNIYVGENGILGVVLTLAADGTVTPTCDLDEDRSFPLPYIPSPDGPPVHKWLLETDPNAFPLLNRLFAYKPPKIKKPKKP